MICPNSATFSIFLSPLSLVYTSCGIVGGGIGTHQACYGKVSTKPGHWSPRLGDDLDRGKSLISAARASGI